MAKIYMVNSEFVNLACLINMGLFLSVTGICEAIPMFFAVCGVLFNFYVHLRAERKLGIIVKFFRGVKNRMLRVKNRLSVYFRRTRTSIVQNFSFSSIVNLVGDFIRRVFIYLRSKIKGTKSKKGRVPRLQNVLPPKESFQSPDPSSSQLATPVNRTRSEPVKLSVRTGKDFRNRALSPELFKNKIYKAKMNL